MEPSAIRQSTPLLDAELPAQAAQHAQPVASATPVQQNTNVLRGMSLVDAVASLGSRNSMVTQMILGADNQVASVRVMDSVTHKLIAETPPDSIARVQQEMMAYQDLAQAQKRI